MKTHQFKNRITYLFLVLFILMKIAGLHAALHTDVNNDDHHALHCLICDRVNANNLTPVLPPDSQDFSIENYELAVQREISENYSFIISNAIPDNLLFCRPPPFLL